MSHFQYSMASSDANQRILRTTGSSPLQALRRPLVSRMCSSVSALAFIFVFYLSPISEALAAKKSNATASVQSDQSDKDMNKLLRNLQKMAASKRKELRDGGRLLKNNEIRALADLSTLLSDQHALSMMVFAEMRDELASGDMSDIILQRHQDTVEQYASAYDGVQALVQKVLDATSFQTQSVALDELIAAMGGHKLERTHERIDPNNLPWGIPDASKTRKPGDDDLGFLDRDINGWRPVMSAANSVTTDMLARLDVPNAADLIETPDVQLTEAIRSKAAELNDNPIEIYNWVRNHIKFIPSHGSIQGADFTLKHGKGNAIDTASLLIALLRSSNVPARYAYGTIEVPVEKVMNWVGGVDVPEAAQQLLGQGGIPNVAIISGGRISHIRMETVWAEAWVDYFPSRGVRNDIGDSWVPLDASFKQYKFENAADFESEVPFDTQQLVDQLSQAGSINTAQGSLVVGDPAYSTEVLTNYSNSIDSYLASMDVNSTTADVIGSQKVIIKEYHQLAAGLPYEMRSRSNTYSELPENLRHKFRYTIGTESYGTESSRLITVERSLPELAGKKLALSFKAASQADQDLINRYVPAPDPVTQDIDPALLPGSLPGYLINLVADFTIDGQTVADSNVGTMGSELYETLAMWSPALGWSQAVNHPVAGEYRAIGLDLQGANPGEAERLESDIAVTQQKLDSGDAALLDTITKHDLVGDLLNSTIYAYLTVNNMQDELQARPSGVITYRMPSFGIFSTSLETSYWYGIPRHVSFGGLVIDVDRIASQTVAKNNNREDQVTFTMTSGARASAMEHVIPEKMFSTDEFAAYGMSAVKALALAGAESQKIWLINSENVDEALQAINLSPEAESDIRNGVAAGKIATAHEKPVHFAGGTSFGYLLIDPETGAGGYLVSGGASGGLLDIADKGLEKMINYIGNIHDSVGAAGYLKPLKPLKKLLGQAKNTLQNMRTAIEIIENCNPAGSLLATVIIGIQIAVMAKAVAIAVASMGLACAVTTGPAAPYCTAAASYFILPYILQVTNFFAEDSLNFVADGCRS